MSITKWPCIVVLLSFCMAQCACQWRGDVGIRKMADSNHIFTEHLLWTTVCQSKISCGIICLNDPSCVRFTVSENTKGKLECRGHSGQGTGKGQWSEGAVFYVLQTRTSVSTSTAQHQSLTTTSEPVVTTTTPNDKEFTTDKDQDFTTVNEEDFSDKNDQDFSSNTDQDFSTQNGQIYTTAGGTKRTNGKCSNAKECQATWSNSKCVYGFCICTTSIFPTPCFFKGKTECRGHSAVINTENGQPSPGSRLYVLQSRAALATVTTTQADHLTTSSDPVITTATNNWLNKTCSSDSECEEPHSECFDHRCLCTPGYYYSMSGATCLDDCPAADLQNDFIKYPHSMIRDYSLANFPRYETFTDCVQLCLSSSTPCRSFDFMVTSTMCGASHIARFDAPTYWDDNNNKFEYYQRMCL